MTYEKYERILTLRDLNLKLVFPFSRSAFFLSSSSKSSQNCLRILSPPKPPRLARSRPPSTLTPNSSLRVMERINLSARMESDKTNKPVTPSPSCSAAVASSEFPPLNVTLIAIHVNYEFDKWNRTGRRENPLGAATLWPPEFAGHSTHSRLSAAKNSQQRRLRPAFREASGRLRRGFGEASSGLRVPFPVELLVTHPSRLLLRFGMQQIRASKYLESCGNFLIKREKIISPPQSSLIDSLAATTTTTRGVTRFRLRVASSRAEQSRASASSVFEISICSSFGLSGATKIWGQRGESVPELVF